MLVLIGSVTQMLSSFIPRSVTYTHALSLCTPIMYPWVEPCYAEWICDANVYPCCIPLSCTLGTATLYSLDPKHRCTLSLCISSLIMAAQLGSKKLRSPLLRTPGLKDSPFEAWSRSESSHACFVYYHSTRDFFLVYTFLVHSPSFFQNFSLEFVCEC